MYQITRREQLSETTFLWDVFAPDVARAARPGQFVMIRLHAGSERIPLTIADHDAARGTITMVIAALGKSTREMMRMPEGDWFADFVGPLGLPSEVEKLGHVVLVGGGLGVAPIYPQVAAFAAAGCRVTTIVGFRNKDAIFWEERFRPHSAELIVCTDDGSYGRAGFVTVALEELVRQQPAPDRVIAIGPMPMMRACAEVTRPYAVPTVVSLDAIMVDGTGMCGSCRVTVGDKVRFACVDGPEFDAHQVRFDELKARQRRFVGHECKAQREADKVSELRGLLVDRGKRNYKKFKQLAREATPMPERDAKERAHNFHEVNLGYTMAQALEEAERCIQCKVPTCVAGCPVAIDIPGFIRQLLVRDLGAARDVIALSNAFPSICGRVCPQEQQCEAQCILIKKMEPVAIGRLERFVGDQAPSVVRPPPARDPSLGKVAVVGSGPAGLACAADLARAGAEVVVYEALHVVGGVLRYGIPAFRLPRGAIDREVASLEHMGVRFETNKVVGLTFTIAQLRDEMGFGAVFVGTGAGYPMFLGLEGESAGGVLSANEFLTRVNLMGGDRFPYLDTPVGMGGSVVVIGAGNTAMDCLRVARRLGATSVRCVYRRTEAEAPARVEELRHAREEGVRFHFLRSPLGIDVDEGGAITGIRCQRMQLGEPDASGRRRPVPVEGAVETIPCDTVIYALGTRANPIIGRSTPDLALNRWGYIEADDGSQATNLPGVFAGGDIVTGGATVILAMGAGRRAARGILSWLREGFWPPALAEAGLAAVTPDRCPRCHGDLAPGERYICCAGETLQWRCDGCHRVSEGFAFPFGLCPSCGGHLRRTETGTVDAREVVRQAMEIELGGTAFYRRGAGATPDPALRSLFLRLAAMEQEHLDLLSRRYHLPAPSWVNEGASTAHLAVYAGMEADVDGVVDLLELALELERRARDFFAERSRELKEGSPEWRLCRELEAEEYGHVALLETELERRREGRAGIL